MILSSLAAHWFEPIEDFYIEADRVLSPGGCLVIYCYGNPEFNVQHKEKDIMSKLIMEVHFFSNFLEDMSPFRAATDTPVLDFW